MWRGGGGRGAGGGGAGGEGRGACSGLGAVQRAWRTWVGPWRTWVWVKSLGVLGCAWCVWVCCKSGALGALVAQGLACAPGLYGDVCAAVIPDCRMTMASLSSAGTLASPLHRQQRHNAFNVCVVQSLVLPPPPLVFRLLWTRPNVPMCVLLSIPAIFTHRQAEPGSQQQTRQHTLQPPTPGSAQRTAPRPLPRWG